jgi:activator of HSP90 ATPase
MMPFQTLLKRVLLAGSVVLVTACGKNSPTEPSAQRSGYLTVSASVSATQSGTSTVKPATTTSTTSTTSTVPVSSSGPKRPSSVTASGYNVPAN